MSSTELHAGEATGKRLAVLALAALGVVYGDIGTSPLYAVKEVFAGNHPIPVTEANIYGSLSLFFWALVETISRIGHRLEARVTKHLIEERT